MVHLCQEKSRLKVPGADVTQCLESTFSRHRILAARLPPTGVFSQCNLLQGQRIKKRLGCLVFFSFEFLLFKWSVKMLIKHRTMWHSRSFNFCLNSKIKKNKKLHTWIYSTLLNKNSNLRPLPSPPPAEKSCHTSIKFFYCKINMTMLFFFFVRSLLPYFLSRSCFVNLAAVNVQHAPQRPQLFCQGRGCLFSYGHKPSFHWPCGKRRWFTTAWWRL